MYGFSFGASSADSDGTLSALVMPPVVKIIGHLLGDLQRDIDLRFGGRGAEMRRRDEARRPEQRRFLRRFGREHVKRGARDMPRIEPGLQRRLVDQPATRAIDEAHALLGLGEIFR